MVEVKIAGNTLQQKTRVRSQTSRKWMERRLSGWRKDMRRSEGQTLTLKFNNSELKR